MPIRERIGEAYVRIHGIGDDIGKKVSDDLDRADADIGEAGERQSRKYIEHWDMKTFRADMIKMFESMDDDVSDKGDDHGRRYSKSFTKRFDEIRHGLVDMLDNTSDRIGGLLGRGSRNDFVHFFGSLASGISRLLFLGPKLVATIGGDVVKAFRDADGGIKGVVAGIQSLGGAAATGLLSLTLLAGGVAALMIVLGPFAALISGLLGIVTALVSTLSFGLVGALAAVGGALVPLAAGIGIVVLGLTNLSDRAKDRISETTESLRKDFTLLGKDVGNILTEDIGGNTEILRDTLASLRPVILDIADATRDVADGWVDMLDSPAFDRFVDRIDRALPGMIRHLGDAFGNAAGGIFGVFTGAIPLIQDFLFWLDVVTERFNNWANSAEGQRQLEDFFDKAGDSAKRLGGFLDAVWDLIVEILDAGKGDGDSLFKSMEDAIRGWVETLERNPDILKDWFEDARKLGEEIGDLIIDLGELFDELDSSENRAAVRDFTTALGAIADALTVITGFDNDLKNMGLPDWLSDLLGGGGEGLLPLPSRVGNIIGEWIAGLDFGGIKDKLVGAFEDAWEGVKDWFAGLGSIGGGGGGLGAMAIKIKPPNIQDLVGKFAGVGAKIRDKIGNIDFFDRFENPVARILNFFGGISGRILARFTGIDFFSKFDNPTSKILGWFSGMGGRITSRIGTMSLLDLFVNPADIIVGWFDGLAGRIVDAIGTVNIPVSFPDPPGWFSKAAGGVAGLLTANGGVFDGPQWRIIAEAGREAVVPLDRPISQMDPSVAELVRGLAGAGGSSGRPNVDLTGLTLITPTEDPLTVVQEFVNDIVARVA